MWSCVNSLHSLYAQRSTSPNRHLTHPSTSSFCAKLSTDCACECHPSWTSPWTGVGPLSSYTAQGLQFPPLTTEMLVAESKMTTVLGNLRQQAVPVPLLALMLHANSTYQISSYYNELAWTEPVFLVFGFHQIIWLALSFGYHSLKVPHKLLGTHTIVSPKGHCFSSSLLQEFTAYKSSLQQDNKSEEAGIVMGVAGRLRTFLLGMQNVF